MRDRRRVGLACLCLVLTACGGGGGGGDEMPSTPISSFELLDPTPGQGNRFGTSVAILANGNIAVMDPFDSSVVSNNGAVHLYHPITQTRIASIHGDGASDFLGFGGVTVLPNSNFVIVSPSDSVNGVLAAGSVRLVNGATGAQIGSAIAGDAMLDNLGSGGVTVLPNGNFVIVSPLDDEGGIINTGSVRLVNGATGTQIGSAIVGDEAFDQLGSGGVTALANGNFVIVSSFSSEGGVAGAGSVQLVSGVTGAQIGATIAGDAANDFLGSGGVAVLPNGNFVIVSPFASGGGVGGAGSVRLVSGATGIQIGSAIAGDTAGDQLGSRGIVPLPNGNFVIVSPEDDVGGIVNAGSVQLMNGMTGAPIGNPIAGDATNDRVGWAGVIALPNGNYVIASPSDDVGGVASAGSIRLVNGVTGGQIGDAIVGDAVGDSLGSGGVTALANGNFVIVSPQDGVGGVAQAGSVRLVNGATGTQIGPTIGGDAVGDSLGSGGVTALPNGNFVIVSPGDNVNGVLAAGSVRLVNGATGAQIGSAIAGDSVGDFLGLSGVTALANGNFVIVSDADDVGGIIDAGSVRLVNGATGAQIAGAVTGSASVDTFSARVTGSAAGDYYILSLPFADKNGLVDSGLVLLIAQ